MIPDIMASRATLVIELCSFCLMQKYPTKVRVISSFTAESAGFISGNTGELITLISKDRHRYILAYI